MGTKPAPSTASASDDGKISAAGDQTDLEVGSANPIDETAQRNETEKVESLARHATATSQHGKDVERVQTREDGAAYPTGVNLALIVMALCLSVFVMALGSNPAAAAGFYIVLR